MAASDDVILIIEILPQFYWFVRSNLELGPNPINFNILLDILIVDSLFSAVRLDLI
jgi:hypothetical protein